jgi:hypothetical protein
MLTPIFVKKATATDGGCDDKYPSEACEWIL